MPPHLLVLLCILVSSGDAGKSPAVGEKGETFPRNAQPSGTEDEQHARHAKVMGQQNMERYKLGTAQGRSSEQKRLRKARANNSAPTEVIGNISSGVEDKLEQVGSPRVLQAVGSRILNKTAEHNRAKTPQSIHPSISSSRGTPTLEKNALRPPLLPSLQRASEHPTWRSPQLGHSRLVGPSVPERGQEDLYQSGDGGDSENEGRGRRREEAVTPASSNLAWWKGRVKNNQRLHNRSLSCENLTSPSSKFKMVSFNQQPPNSAEESIQFPEDVTFPDAAEADNFLEENLSEKETLASIMREKFQGDGSIDDQSVAGVNMLPGRSLDLAHENEVRQNLSSISKNIFKGSRIADSFDEEFSLVKAETEENRHRSSKDSREMMFVKPELRRQSLKSLEQREQHNTTLPPHLSDTILDTTESGNQINQQNSMYDDLQNTSSPGINDALVTEKNMPGQINTYRDQSQSRTEMASEDTLSSPSRMKREAINYEPRKDEQQANKQLREQTEEDKHYLYEDGVNRRARQGVHNTRLIDVPLVRHGRERLSIIRKRVTRNQTKSYHTFPPNKYYNIFIKNFPQIFKNYHSRLSNQHAHLPVKRIRQQVSNKVDQRGIDHAKKEAGKMSKVHNPYAARLVGRGDKPYGKSPQQRHARSRNRAKRKGKSCITFGCM